MFEAIMNRARELGGREVSPDPATLAFEFDDPDAEADFESYLNAAGIEYRDWSGAVSLSVSDAEED